MPSLKPNYTALTHQVVRESREPLPFAEIMRRVHTLAPVTTGNPKGTIRNAISQSRLIVNTGDGRYGWQYRVINDSVRRLRRSPGESRRNSEYPRGDSPGVPKVNHHMGLAFALQPLNRRD
jgi:hypothetical protein